MAWCFLTLLSIVQAQVKEEPQEKLQYSFLKQISDSLEAVSLQQVDGSLALITKKALEPGEPFMGAQLDQSITSFDIYEWSPFIAHCSEETKIAARLLYLRVVDRSMSYISKYVKGLPHQVHSYPVWTDDEQELLEDFNLFRSKETTYAQDSFKCLHSALKQPELEFDQFKWAYAHAVRGSVSISMSAWRIANQFKVKDTDKDVQGFAFVQLIEMVPHCPVIGTTRKSIQIAINNRPVLIALHADRKFKAGERACIDKGALTNLSLIYREGRVILRNPYDSYSYRLVNMSADYCHELLGNPSCSFQISASFNEQLFYLVRAFTSQDSSVPLTVDYLPYYANLFAGAGETKQDFLRSALAYRSQIRTGVIHVVLTKSLREMRRMYKEEENSHKRTAVELGVVSSLALYQHLASADRLVIGLLAQDLGLIS
jgi:hypothetical protein